MPRRFADNDQPNVEAKFEAQQIAFAPFVFQAAKCLRDFGVLEALKDAGPHGMTLEDLQGKIDVPRHGLSVLLEAGNVGRMLSRSDDRFSLTKTGYFVLMDKMTRVNMDFTHDVCYRGMFHLDEAVRTGKPAGLQELGDWPTVYQALAHLPEKVRQSWFGFDHFYSDAVFPKLLPIVFECQPRTILDVGGNTGKWALACAQYVPDVKITILDLPGQLAEAARAAAEAGLSDRIDGVAIDFLDPTQEFPRGADVIWMSQFLDCFSEEQIVSIAERARRVMRDETMLYVLETFSDRQGFDAGRFCVVMTSLYFTCMANGNSKMYGSRDMRRCLERAGLVIERELDGVGLSHTLLVCRKA